MAKHYRAIYDHGTVEWIDGPPDIEYASIVVVVDETTEKAVVGDNQQQKSNHNGDVLVSLIERWPESDRHILEEKFGDPVRWQQEQRQERPLSGREEG